MSKSFRDDHLPAKAVLDIPSRYDRGGTSALERPHTQGHSRKLRRVEEGQQTVGEFAGQLNEMAIATLKQDGEHAAMFFLRLETGQVQPRLFESDQQRGRDLADAAELTAAHAVCVVAEAWAASGTSIPDGGRVRDSAGARDILLVAALDRSGNQAVFETTISRRRLRAPVLEPSRAYYNNFRVPVLDETRELWGLSRGAFTMRRGSAPWGLSCLEDGALRRSTE